jgi:hypothetical protein
VEPDDAELLAAKAKLAEIANGGKLGGLMARALVEEAEGGR